MSATLQTKNSKLQELRNEWREAKKLAVTEEVKAAWEEAQEKLGKKFSLTAFVFVKSQLNALGLEGTPYIDTKTYQAWKESGFIVKKGEVSKIKSIVFMPMDKDEKSKKLVAHTGDNDSDFLIPKVYSLFHTSQVKAL